MSTVNFSVPEEVKQAFNAVFQGRNKSAIIAELMIEAVERAKRQERAIAAAQRIRQRRETAPVTTESRIRSARERDRP